MICISDGIWSSSQLCEVRVWHDHCSGFSNRGRKLPGLLIDWGSWCWKEVAFENYLTFEQSGVVMATTPLKWVLHTPWFNQQWIQNCIFYLWLVTKKILFWVSGWLNLWMGNPQVQKADFIYEKIYPCINGPVLFKPVLFKSHLFSKHQVVMEKPSVCTM